MRSYTSATLLLNEKGGWWLYRGISNPHTAWIEWSTNKVIDEPNGFQEPWQVPALGGMPLFTNAQAPIDRILPNSVFKVTKAKIMDEQPAHSKGYDAYIYVEVESINNSSGHHLTETEEYKLFTQDELVQLVGEANNYTKPTLELMTTLEASDTHL